MKKYSTSISNLRLYIPIVQFTKEELMLINFFKIKPSDSFEQKASILCFDLNNIQSNDDFIIDLSKKNEILKLSIKKYSRATLEIMLHTYSLLFNKKEIFFNNDLSLDLNNSMILLAKNYSNPNDEVFFWSPIDPNFLQIPINAEEVVLNVSFSESRFNHLSSTFNWQEYIPQSNINETSAYIKICSYEYNIFENANLNPNDPLDIVFLIESICSINKKINSLNNFTCVEEWINILNVPSEFKKEFNEDFTLYLNKNNYKDSSINDLKYNLLVNIFRNISHEAILDSQVISSILKNILNLNIININNFHDNEIIKIMQKHDLFNSESFYELSYNSQFSPLYLLKRDYLKDHTDVQFNYSNSFYTEILNKISKTDYSEDNIKKIVINEDLYIQQFFTYLSKYLNKFENEILSNADITLKLKNLNPKQTELFIWGFALFSNNFKNNIEIISFISEKISTFQKKSPFTEENHLVNAILKSYNFDVLYKNKAKLINFKNGYFTTAKQNKHKSDNYKGNFLNEFIGNILCLEFSELISSKSLKNIDCNFLSNMLNNCSHGDTENLKNLINNHPNFPELKKLGDPYFIKEIISYFLRCSLKLKEKLIENENKTNTDLVKKTISIITLLTSMFTFYAYENNPEAFDKNVFNINIDNFNEYKGILFYTAHFSMINPVLMNSLDINNIQHHEFFKDMLCKFTIKASDKILTFSHVKPFFMLDTVIKGLRCTKKFITSEENKLNLQNMYNSNDVKILFERYKDDKYWFIFSPHTFLKLAPLEYKQDQEVWKNLYRNFGLNIFKHVPLNLKSNSDFFIELVKLENNSLTDLTTQTPKETLNSMNVIQHILEHFPNNADQIYPKLVEYLNKSEHEMLGMSKIDKFNLLFTDKILKETIPVNNSKFTKTKHLKF